MKVVRFVLALFVIAVLFNPFNLVSGGSSKINHTIVGYGHLEGDLFLPLATRADQDHYFVLDFFGMNIFSKKDKQFIARHPVNPTLAYSFSDFYNEGFLRSLLSGTTDIDLISLLENQLTTLISSASFQVDNRGSYYMKDSLGIRSYDKNTGKSNKLIFYPEKVFSAFPSNIFFDLVGSNLYLLCPFDDSLYVYVMDLKGQILQEFLLQTPASILNHMILDFAVSPQGTIAILHYNQNLSSIGLFNSLGEHIGQGTVQQSYFNPLSLCFVNDREIAVAGMSMEVLFGKESNNMITRMIFSGEDPKIRLVENYSLYLEDFGFAILDLSMDADYFLVTSMGSLSRIAESVIVGIPLDETSLLDQFNIGRSPYASGQTHGSFAFTLDEKAHMYQHNFFSNEIQVFNPLGEFEAAIPLDLKEISTSMSVSLPPMITSMAADQGYLYIAQFFPPNISMYSSKSKRWSNLYSGDITATRFSLYLDMKVWGETLFLLDSMNQCIQIIEENGDTSFHKLELPNSYAALNPVFFSSFVLDGQELQVLDGFNHRIVCFQLEDFSWVRTIEIQTYSPFLSSVALHPEQGWLITDLKKHQIHHINLNGVPVSSIGKKAVLKKRSSKEDYQMNADGFWAPLRIAVSGKNLAVNDFLNSRYHLLELP